MTTDALREAQAAYDAAKAEFSSRYRQDYRIPVEAVSPSTNAAAALIAAQAARIAALEAEREGVEQWYDEALSSLKGIAAALLEATPALVEAGLVEQTVVAEFENTLLQSDLFRDMPELDKVRDAKVDEDAAGDAM